MLCEHSAHIATDGAYGVQNLAVCIHHRDCHQCRRGSGFLPQPIGRQLEVSETCEAACAHRSRHEYRSELPIEGDGHQDGLSGFQGEQLRSAGAQRGFAASEQSIAVDYYHGFEGARIGDFLLQR